MTHIEKLNLPKIPHTVITSLLEQNPDLGNYSYVCEPAYDGIAHFSSYTIDVSALSWFKENNLDSYFWNIQTLKDGTNLNAHRDDRRTHVIMYIIDPGGEDVKTCFYRKLLNKEYEPIKPIPKEELELAHEEVLEAGNWYKLSVQDIHSVENLQSTRLCLTRQLPDIPLDLL
jgi:hypothetical protein